MSALTIPYWPCTTDQSSNWGCTMDLGLFFGIWAGIFIVFGLVKFLNKK